MAQIQNPKKKFQFDVAIAGMNSFLCQELTLPDMEIESVAHGDYNHDVKTGGRVSFGNLVIKKISPADQNDSMVFNRLRIIQDAYSTGGALPQDYKFEIIVTHFAPDGFTVTDRYQLNGCWLAKLNGIDLSRTASDNTMEEIEFSVDRMDKII